MRTSLRRSGVSERVSLRGVPGSRKTVLMADDQVSSRLMNRVQGFGFPAAVDHVRLGQVPERSGLEQVVQGHPGPGEHDEVGLHEPAVHLHPVGVLAGEFFLIDGPDGVAAPLVEAVGLEDHLVKAVGLVGDPLQVETAPRVHHDVKPRRPLIAEHDRPRCRCSRRKARRAAGTWPGRRRTRSRCAGTPPSRSFGARPRWPISPQTTALCRAAKAASTFPGKSPVYPRPRGHPPW